MSVQYQLIDIRKHGLEYKQKEDGSFEMVILDPRLNSNVINDVLRLKQHDGTYPQMKKKIGLWFTRKHLHTIETLISLYSGEEINYWRNNYTQLIERIGAVGVKVDTTK